MSSMAKSAREAMKAKAKRLGGDRPTEKVDSSTWSPPELLNADVKTGMRPVSRRAFKKGGKVVGVAAVVRADRKPRKSGGKTEATEFANAKVNRNVKAANEEREGIKHVGGMKKGGRAKKNEGGGASVPLPPRRPPQEVIDRLAKGQSPRATNIEPTDLYDKDQIKRLERGYKKGGKIKKADGGSMSGAQEMMSRAQKTAGVPSDVISSVPASSRFSQSIGMKKGGKAHSDEAMDKALIKKMVKAEARTGRKTGGGVFSGSGYPDKVPGVTGGREARADGGANDKPIAYHVIDSRTGKVIGKFKNCAAANAMVDRKDNDFGAYRHRRVPVYADQVSDSNSNDRTGRATGGRTKGKGKTNINIVIAAGKTPGSDAGVLPPDMGQKPAGGVPIPMPAQGGAPQGGMPMPMPVPMPMPAAVPAGQPPMGRKTGGRVGKFGGGAMGTSRGHIGGPGRTGVAPAMPPGQMRPAAGGSGRPMPVMAGAPVGQVRGPAATVMRKAGGRISKVASSYKDMEAGSGGGEGRLQKTDIAKKGKDAPTFKKGGKVYRSYKDMDAGAASGLGRLEKTEIASRRR